MRSPDWPVRRAAAEALKALTITLGPQLDGATLPVTGQTPSAAAADALDKCRFDKVKPVRDSMLEALAVLQDLQVWSLLCITRSVIMTTMLGRQCMGCDCHEPLAQQHLANRSIPRHFVVGRFNVHIVIPLLKH